MDLIDSGRGGDDRRGSQIALLNPAVSDARRPNLFGGGSRDLNRFDREIIEFLLAWAPYGEPPEEESLPRFGMRADRVWNYVADIVMNRRGRLSNADDRALVAGAAVVLARRPTLFPMSRQSEDRLGPIETADQIDISAGQWVASRGVWRWQSTGCKNSLQKG